MDNYLQAARVLDGVLSRKGSIKTLALRPEIKNKRFVTALVSETLRHKAALDTVMTISGLRPTLAQSVHDSHLLYLLLFDLLFGKGIQGGGQVKRLLLAHEPALRKAAEGVEGPTSRVPAAAAFPRYARVNPLKTTVAAAKAALVKGEGKGDSGVVASEADVQEDPHIPSLLVLPPGTDLHAHPLVARGALVLQDKASCFSAQALLGDVVAEGQKGKKQQAAVGDVIDACAAPGNKTSHVAALLHTIANNAGSPRAPATKFPPPRKSSKARVFAFDRDAARLATLKRRVGDGEEGGMGYSKQLVVPLCQDFLALDPADPRMGKVRAILLDPSCSGSGMVASLERGLDGGGSGEQGRKNWRAGVKDGGPTARLRALAEFQSKALAKAFSFPQVERVVYSTCSIHAEEDEMVAAAALQGEAEKAKAHKGYRPFELRPALPDWPRRGIVATTPDGRLTGLTEAQAACVARTDPTQDRTNGFFVARFDRRGGGGVWVSGGKGEQGNGGKGKKRQREEDREEEDEEAGGKEEEEERTSAGAASPQEKEEEEGRQGDVSGGGPTRAQRRRARRKRVKQQLGGQQGQEKETAAG